MTAGSGTLNWTDNSPRGRTPGSMPVNPPNLDGWDAWCEACATHRPPQLHEGARSKEWRPINNKFSQLSFSPVIRNTLGQSESTLDFADIMKTGKLCFADLSEGKIGQENSA